uniref:Uncharacterized protein n=1 Tax=Setaria digitata TaxID=48799 RepID=A0A915PSN0_9BILA
MLLLRFIRRHFYIYLLFVLFAIFLLWIRKGSQIAKLEIEVAVVTVLKDDSNIEEYRLAMQTLECYCIQHRYAWIVIDVSLNETLKLLCPQDQFFFQRHCVTAQFLQENNYDYILFVDSDMGVINPKRRIEEYIMNDKDIIFYNRIWNFEVMAGKKPNLSSISYECGPITITVYLIPFMGQTMLPFISYTDVFIFEVCVRAQLEENEVWKKKIVVLPKGQSWARDGWLTDSKWSQQDFILHGWQKWSKNFSILYTKLRI